jgi:outer membrane lipoprotein-sorting protein
MKTTLACLTVIALALWAAPAPAATTPALTAFDETFAKVNDYTVTVHAHEVKGDRVQDRVYQYWFKRPSLAKVEIVSGDGVGSGGVWKGGDVVRGHRKILFLKPSLVVSIHDPQATSLRGYTIPDGLLQNEIAKYKEIKGQLIQTAGPEIDGTPTDSIELKIADPASHDNITRAILYVSKSTHFPVRQIRYEGDKIVADDTFTDLKTNVGLTDSDFPF